MELDNNNIIDYSNGAKNIHHMCCANKRCNPDENITHIICDSRYAMNNWATYACCPECFQEIISQNVDLKELKSKVKKNKRGVNVEVKIQSNLYNTFRNVTDIENKGNDIVFTIDANDKTKAKAEEFSIFDEQTIVFSGSLLELAKIFNFQKPVNIEQGNTNIDNDLEDEVEIKEVEKPMESKKNKKHRY